MKLQVIDIIFSFKCDKANNNILWEAQVQEKSGCRK